MVSHTGQSVSIPGTVSITHGCICSLGVWRTGSWPNQCSCQQYCVSATQLTWVFQCMHAYVHTNKVGQKSICTHWFYKLSRLSWRKVPVNTLKCQTFPVVLHEVCTHCSWYVGRLLHADLLKSCDVWWLFDTDFHSLLRFSTGFRSRAWLGPSRSLKAWDHWLCWNIQPCFMLNVFTNGRRCLAKISRFQPPSLHSRWGIYTKQFHLTLVWLHDVLPVLLWIIQMVSSKLSPGLRQRRTFQALQGFSPRYWVLVIATFVTVVAALFFDQFSLCGSGLFLTVLKILCAPQSEILHGAPGQVGLSVIL